jgi:hypothetical protein
LVAIVPATRIYSQQVPAIPEWPFIKLGPSTSAPIRASCTDGASVSFSVHGFAKPRLVGRNEVETAEDHASRIGENIKNALEGKGVDIPGAHIGFRLNELQLLQDGGEASAFHFYGVITARVIA